MKFEISSYNLLKLIYSYAIHVSYIYKPYYNNQCTLMLNNEIFLKNVDLLYYLLKFHVGIHFTLKPYNNNQCIMNLLKMLKIQVAILFA